MDIYNISSQEVLDRIARNCPKALGAYLHCLNRADPEGVVYFTKETIEIEMSESMTRFRNNIKALARENLLMWYPFDHGIAVTLAVIDEE